MIRDETVLHAFRRLADALSDEILNASDADIDDAVPGYGGRVAADRWRQRVRRIGRSVEETMELAGAAMVSEDVDLARGENAP